MRVTDEEIRVLARGYPWEYADVHTVVRTWEGCRAFSIIVAALDFCARGGMLIANTHTLLSVVDTDQTVIPKWLQTSS